jgi:hypothetical protein
MTMASHTPTPWFVFDGTPHLVHAEAPNPNGHMQLAQCGSPTNSVACANAAFIVQAVNSHGALLEALKAVMGGQLGGDVDLDATRFQAARWAIALAEKWGQP